MTGSVDSAVMRRRPWRLLALLTVIAVALAACPADEPPDDAAPPVDDPEMPEPADETFNIAVGVDFDTFDPAGTTTTTVGNMVAYMVQTLTVIDEDGDVHPQLATEWDVSEDGLTYTLQLREGVVFHDGTPFDAEAVVFTFDRVLDEEVTVPIRAPFLAIEEVVATDEHEVEIRLSRPFPPMISALSFDVAGIISPQSIEEHGNSYTDYSHPVGTGPYVYGSYSPGERFVVDRFDDYWGELPYYSEVVFHIVPEAATRVSQLRAGQVQMIILPPISDLPALEDDPDVEVLLAPGNRTIFMAINNNEVDDVRVRQAMNYAVDRDTIIERVLFGAADPVDAPMDESLWGHCSVGEWPYDPERAQELMDEAGVDSLDLRFIAPTGRYVQDFEVAQAVSGYLEEIGINASVETMDWPSYVARITQTADEQEQDLHLLGWAPSYMDSFQHMVIFQTDQQPPNGLATAFYSNSEVDELLASAAVEIDEDTRQQMYCDASEIIWDEAPWIFMYSQRFPIVYRAEVTNVSYRPNESFYAVYAHPRQ
jgi:ABC-type transport system substrate-binding protein